MWKYLNQEIVLFSLDQQRPLDPSAVDVANDTIDNAPGNLTSTESRLNARAYPVTED
jgi:hypothetical protein